MLNGSMDSSLSRQFVGRARINRPQRMTADLRRKREAASLSYETRESFKRASELLLRERIARRIEIKHEALAA